MKNNKALVLVVAVAVFCWGVKLASANSNDDIAGRASPQFYANLITAAVAAVTAPQPIGDHSVAGGDANHNGVRDDVEDYIAEKFPGSMKERAALMQLARAYQNVLLASSNGDSAYHNALRVDRSLDCILYVFAGKPNRYDVSSEIFAQQINTKERFHAYVHYEQQLGGKFFTLGKSDASACDAKVDTMKN